MSAKATEAGTAAFSLGFPEAVRAGFFRRALGLTVSSLGLGTYLGRDDDAGDQGYFEAVVAGVAGGINVLDSAVNYRLQRSERAIGRALRELSARGFPREGVLVATKGGYVPSRDPESYFQEYIVKPGLAHEGDLVAGCHSLAPGYLRHQLGTSLENLGLGAVDVYYLHNPEQQLDEVDETEFLKRMRRAFEFLEAAASEGKIGVYGTATWAGYRLGAGEPGALSLEGLVRIAREVAGESHHFRMVQLPFNLAMSEAWRLRGQSLGGTPCALLEAAQELGIGVMTSASILQGRLSAGLPEGLKGALPRLESDALRAIEFARSAPGVTTALVGMGRPGHVRENLKILSAPPLTPEAFQALFA